MAETKSGSYIYNGDPSTFYDWKFRTELRLKLYEDAIRSKASQARSTRGDSEAGLEGEVDPDHNVREPEAADTADEEHEGPQEEGGLHPGGADEYFDKLSQLSAGSRRSKKSGKSAKPISFEYLEGLPSSTKARTEMVHRVLEGLRDEAFELARDIGVDALTAPGGLRSFIERMREVVFPRATEEARELFRAGQRPGTLSRQAGESMLSYISRRRRWWNLLKTLDASIELSEPMHVELLLELSGLSRQEALVVKACTADPKKFEQIANTLVQHYTGVHLREGRALGGSNPQPYRNTGKGYGPRSYGSNRSKGKGFTRKAFPAIDEDAGELEQEEEYPEEDSYFAQEAFVAEESWEEEPPAEEEEFEEYELDEDEAIALNAMEQFLEDSPEVGHAIQLSLAANAAFGKAKGKGKNRSKGKGKGKGKVVRSHLTLEQRRDKLKALKAKSRCMRCGGIGHWAGDPECKFPAGKAAGKAAHVAVTVLSSEEGLVIPSEAPDKDHSGFVVRAAASKSAASRSAAVASAAPMPFPMEMEGGDRKFYLGQYKGKTYNEIARLPAVVQWAQVQVNPSRQLQDFLAWFNRYYVIEGDEVVTRASIGIPEGTYVPRVKNKGGKKVPPNPPLEPCVQGCKDFTHAGSTMNWLRSTCRDCGKVTREPREVSYTNDPETCPHEIIDRRGSSRSVSRTFCKQCGTFIDEVPADFQRRRRDAANRMLNATVDSLSVMHNTQIAGESRDLERDDVELIMGVFNDSVTTMIEMGMRVTPSVLHSRLSEAIVDALEPTGDSPDSWSRVGHVGIIDPTDLTKEERVLSRWERLVKGVNWQDHCGAWEDAFLMGHDRLGIAILEAQWADPAPAPSTGINLSLTLDDLEQARPESPQVPDPVGPEQGWTRLGQLPEIDPDEAIDDSLAFPDYDPYDPYLECTPTRRAALTEIWSSESSVSSRDSKPDPEPSSSSGLVPVLPTEEQQPRARGGYPSDAVTASLQRSHGNLGGKGSSGPRHAHAASTDIVHLDNLPMVDLWSPDEPDVWGALDEGCNSTCHSRTWAIQTEARLKAYGFQFPWLDSNPKSFSGLGATSRTLGKRKLPFCLELGDQGRTLAGVLDSHEVDTDAHNPLLISLFAQSTLGLVKDMRSCCCWLTDSDGEKHELRLARCKDTGLLLVNLSSFTLRGNEFPKCVRECKLQPSQTSQTPQRKSPPELVGSCDGLDPSGHPACTGLDLSGQSKAMAVPREVDYHEYLESGMLWDQVRPKTFTTPPPIVILSCGIKYYMNKEDGWWGKKARDPIHWADRVPQVFRDGYTLIVQDLRDLSDPANGAWNDHIGRHPEIIKGLVNAEAGQRLLRKNLVDLLDHYKRGEKVALVAFCTSNRHRSVAFGTTLAACLLAKGIEDHLLVHLNAITSWKGMVCGGGCSDCGEFSKPGLVNLGKHANSLLDALEGFDEANRHQNRGRSAPPAGRADAGQRGGATGSVPPVRAKAPSALHPGVWVSGSLPVPMQGGPIWPPSNKPAPPPPPAAQGNRHCRRRRNLRQFHRHHHRRRWLSRQR